MNTSHAPGRISSLDPFAIGAVETQTTLSHRVMSASTPNEAVEEIAEFGCVDWYLYPSVRGTERAARPGPLEAGQS